MSLKQLHKGTGSYDARSFGGQVLFKPFTFDFSGITKYKEGGHDCDIAIFYNHKPHGVIIAPKDGYVFQYDAENQKIMAFEVDSSGPLVEVSEDTDLSSIGEVLILAWGM